MRAVMNIIVHRIIDTVRRISVYNDNPYVIMQLQFKGENIKKKA